MLAGGPTTCRASLLETVCNAHQSAMLTSPVYLVPRTAFGKNPPEIHALLLIPPSQLLCQHTRFTTQSENAS
eukprot:COSAG01_NODE_8903_length_2621_cov_1.653450_2_plen_72_part_00